MQSALNNYMKRAARVSGRSCFWAGVLAILLCGSAQAGQLNVSPVRLSLAADARATSVTVSNPGLRPVGARVELMVWTQADGKELLVPAQDLIVTPPILRLEPGDRQVVRIGRPASVAVPAVEQAYRLVVRQLPLPDPAAELAAQSQPGLSLRTVLEISLPLFVPPVRVDRQLHLALDLDGGLWLRNSGTVHRKLNALVLRDLQGQALAEHLSLLYVLPGQQRRLPLQLQRPLRPGESLQLDLQLDERSVQRQIQAERR